RFNIDAPALSPSFDGLAGAGMIDEDSPHGLGCRPQEVTSRFERPRPRQFQIRLVNEGRRVKRMPRLFAGHLRGRDFPQLVVDERQEIRSRLTVAALGRLEESRRGSHFFGSGSGVALMVSMMAAPGTRSPFDLTPGPLIFKSKRRWPSAENA